MAPVGGAAVGAPFHTTLSPSSPRRRGSSNLMGLFGLRPCHSLPTRWLLDSRLRGNDEGKGRHHRSGLNRGLITPSIVMRGLDPRISMRRHGREIPGSSPGMTMRRGADPVVVLSRCPSPPSTSSPRRRGSSNLMGLFGLRPCHSMPPRWLLDSRLRGNDEGKGGNDEGSGGNADGGTVRRHGAHLKRTQPPVDSRFRGNDEGERGNDERERGNDEVRGGDDISSLRHPRESGGPLAVRHVKAPDDGGTAGRRGEVNQTRAGSLRARA